MISTFLAYLDGKPDAGIYFIIKKRNIYKEIITIYCVL